MKDLSREELLIQVDSLNRWNKELLHTIQESEQLEYGWTGNLGQWFWNCTTNEVEFNSLKVEAIGYQKEDLPEKVPYQFFTDKIHPEDKKEVMRTMKEHMLNKIPIWEVKYRIQAKDGSWRVYQDRGRVTERDKNGAPLFLKGIVFDVTKEEQEREQLTVKNKNLINQIKVDTLTHLHTRSSIIVEMAKCANKSKEENYPLSVIFLNIDKYSKYEEEFGLLLSEEILKTLGQLIQSVIQEKYVAGRYRESVFLILLENIPKEEAYNLAETIRKTVLETFFVIPNQISISGGITVYDPSETISELVQKASGNLEVAKNNGGNQIIL
ncbi:MAG: sensor domain-containing diguanylate cyclase [Carnobacterium sp.]|uniref:sensor domain-containing diguanylate cyclase n=1 Tax=Carnobacterium sp. TaxID=48221 RepID=UPI0033153FF5